MTDNFDHSDVFVDHIKLIELAVNRSSPYVIVFQDFDFADNLNL